MFFLPVGLVRFTGRQSSEQAHTHKREKGVINNRPHVMEAVWGDAVSESVRGILPYYIPPFFRNGTSPCLYITLSKKLSAIWNLLGGEGDGLLLSPCIRAATLPATWS